MTKYFIWNLEGELSCCEVDIDAKQNLEEANHNNKCHYFASIVYLEVDGDNIDMMSLKWSWEVDNDL